MPVLDVHTHVFPPDVIKTRDRIALRDLRFSSLYANPQARMVEETGISRYMDEEQIARAVVTTFPFKDRGLITACNDYVMEIASRNMQLIPFVMVDADDEMFALEETARCLRLGARGIGEIAYYEKGFGKREKMGLSLIADYAVKNNIPMMIHVNEQVGHTYHGKTKMDFQQLVTFVENHPTLTTILSHLGGGICFYEFMPEIKSAFSSVYYDLAAVPLLYSKEVYQFLSVFMPDKVLFGSDYPLLSYKRYKKDMDLLEEQERQKILYLNAESLFRPLARNSHNGLVNGLG
jgi:uncharacterized protein